MSRQDKVLHAVFVVNLIIMISCAVATVMCFLSDKGQITKFPRNKVSVITIKVSSRPTSWCRVRRRRVNSTLRHVPRRVTFHVVSRSMSFLRSTSRHILRVPACSFGTHSVRVIVPAGRPQQRVATLRGCSCFRQEVDLTTEEIITLSCGVLFFVSFFIAMSVQIKAKHTVYQLCVKFVMHNMEWEIDE